VDHVNARQVIRHVAGELTPDERARIDAHAAACADCRARIAQQQALHAALAGWTAEPPSVDLTAATLRRLDAGPATPVWRIRLAPAMRVAAAVVVGVGVGYAAGRWARAPGTADRVAPVVEATPPSYGLLSEPGVVGLWVTYDELTDPDAEDAS
jgi:anti-sigma factor RsiW